jgi:hypothetical protein
MSRHPSHRGPAPKDDRLFAAGQFPILRAATADLCWLLDRGYSSRSAVVLIGNRYTLRSRQRKAVHRCACSLEALELREQRRVEPVQLRGQEVWLDGYNVLTVLESALSGGIVLLGRDGCCRDIAGIHRRYRKVEETVPVLRMIGEAATAWGVVACQWFLDKPVSNSGRLKALILESAAAAGWNMQVELVFSPDRVLSQTEHVVVTSDGIILERCRRWVNLARSIIAESIPKARVVDLAGE